MNESAPPDNRELALGMTYFHRDSETVFFCNPKCASTSLQAFFAYCEGIDIESWCDAAVYDEVAWEQALGQTRAHGVLSGQWPNLDATARQQALASDSVRRLAFVREPLSRVWSAWLSKVCSREPAFRHLAPSTYEVGSASWIRRISELDGALREFDEFVRTLVSGGSAALDLHFAPQSSFLVGLAPDIEFLDVSEADKILTDLLTVSSSPSWRPPRFNTTGFPVPRGMISEETRSGLADFYASDLEAFGAAFREEQDLRPDEARLRWAKLLPTLSLRIQAATRLSSAFEEMGRQRERLVGERDVARARADSLEAGLLELSDDRDAAWSALATVYGSTSWRLTRPGRAVADAVRRLRNSALDPHGRT